MPVQKNLTPMAPRRTDTFEIKELSVALEDTVSASSEDEEIVGITQTAHKRAEESGRLAPEPLLTENPKRFVLFPIQDDEVRTICYCFVCLFVIGYT